MVVWSYLLDRTLSQRSKKAVNYLGVNPLGIRLPYFLSAGSSGALSISMSS